MKTFKTLAVIFVLFAAITNLQAGDKIRIKLHQPPPNMLGVGDMWNLTLENTTKSDLKIYLTGTATEEKDGLIIEGKSKVFTIKPGRSTYKYNDFSGAEVNYSKEGRYKESLIRQGKFPEGNYTICVTAFDESGTEVGRENCIMQNVQQMGNITLLTPGDGEELDPDTLPGLMFSWTPLPKGGPYSLRIVELKGDQSPDVAIRENRPILDKSGITTTSFQYPITGPKLEAGKKYAWQVTSGDVQSDIHGFVNNDPRDAISLVSPTNGQEIDSDTLPGLVFKWRECPLCPPMFTLRIVELKGDQSPEDAFRTNPPIFEKEYQSTTTQGDPVPGVVVKRGYKYAWQIFSGDFISEVRIIKGPPLNPTNPNEPGISLVTPTNGQEIDPDTLPGLMFSWKRNDPCPPRVICKYTLRIVELKGDQSPEVAIKENQPVIIKEGAEEFSSYLLSTADKKLKAGKKYAWQVSSGDVVSEAGIFTGKEDEDWDDEYIFRKK